MPALLRPLPPSPNAFTLIELLVVISIIAVLASMLLPAVGMVRSSSKKTVCQSNMRQMYTGIMTYTNDWDGTVMYSYNLPTDTKAWGENWGQTLAVYMEIPIDHPIERSRLGVFNCPENMVQNQVMGMLNAETELSYSGNGWDPTCGPWNGRFFFAPVASMHHTTELLAFWEGVYYISESWSNDGAGTIPATTVGMRSVRYVHRGKTNTIFADGHVDGTSLLNYQGSFVGGSGADAASYANGRAFYAR